MTIQARAQLNRLRVAPRKARLVADLVRGKSIADAKVQLAVSKKHVSRAIEKLIDSAVANAVHNHMAQPETLVIESIFVNEGPTMKRWMPRAMGRATPLNKRTSHITVIVAGEGKSATVRTEEVADTKKEETPAEEKKTEKKPAAKKKATKKKATSKKKSTKKEETNA